MAPRTNSARPAQTHVSLTAPPSTAHGRPKSSPSVQPTTPTALSNPPFGLSSGARLEWSHIPIKRGAPGPGRGRKHPPARPLCTAPPSTAHGLPLWSDPSPAHPTAPSNPPFGLNSGARLQWSHGPIKRGAAGPGRARKPPVGAPLAEQAEGYRAVSPGPVDVTAGRTARGAQGVRANRGGSWLKRRVRFQRSHPRRRGATTARAVWGRWGKRKRVSHP